MKKEYTQEEQDAAWRRYKLIKILAPIVVVSIAGLYFLGKSLLKNYQQKKSKERTELRLKELIQSPTDNSYFVLMNKYQDVGLKVISTSRDSVSCQVCLSPSEKFSWKIMDIYNACQNSSKQVTIAKTDLLNGMCNSAESKGGYCQKIPVLHAEAPFKVRSGFNFNGVALKVSMGWNINETKEKEITLVNEGLPVKIKEIRSSNGEIKQLSKTLPAQINSNSRMSMVVPIKRGWLPNRNYNRYHPHDFEILVETPHNGEELYRVTFADGNLRVNSSHLIN